MLLALITARGGSKGIPRKNIADLGGKPLIAWTIEAARTSSLINRTLVSTDDPEIAEISRQYKAEVPFIRPPELAADTSPHLPVIHHALEWLLQHEKVHPRILVLLQPTSPFRSASDIDNALQLLIQNQTDTDAVIAVTPSPTPLWLLRTTSQNGFLQPVSTIPATYLRRQDAPPLYAVNGALYACKTEIFLKENTLAPPRTRPYIMTPENALDIDVPADLELARKSLASPIP